MKRLLFLLFLCINLCLTAQVYNLTRYSIEEGLTQSQVRAIFQDSRGFIWLGTHRGVCKFDGKTFVDFQPETGLSGRFVNAITEDKQGNIWIATENGLSKYDGIGFENFQKDKGLTANTILSLLCDSDGRIWIGTEGGGIFLYEKGALKALQSSIGFDILTIKEDTNTKLVWIGTSTGLFLARNQKVEKAKGFPDITVNAILPDERIGLWLGTNKGIIRYKAERAIFFTQQIADKNIYTLVADENKQIWAGSGAGIVQLNYHISAEQNISVTSNSFKAKNWSNQNVVKAAAMDDEGNLWFGTEGEGVYKVRKGLFTTYSEEEGLNSNIVKSFLEDKKGKIWTSTTNFGINILSPQTSKDSSIQFITKEKGLSGNDICYSFTDSKGNFWFATYTHGLSRFDGNTFQRYSTYEGLSSNQTFCVAEDNKGAIWVGTDKGVNIWDGMKFSHLSTQNGLISNVVYTIFHDSKGNAWVGTPSGLSCMSMLGGVRNFTTKDSLNDNLVLRVLEDKKGNIWAATSRGICTWNGKKWAQILIPGNTAANDVVSMLFEKNSETLWLGTNYGIFKMNLQDYYAKGKYTFEHYTTSDGLPSLECNANAMYQDSKGNIWVGTIEGAVCYRADASILKNIRLKSYITAIKLFFKDIKQEKKYFSSINTSTFLPEDLILPYNQNHITFDFIGICYSKPSAVRYQIRLEGFDEDWLPLTDETKFTYSNLPAGHYTFRVRATYNLRDWVEAAPFSFQITQPFWFTWWFLLLTISLLVLIGFGIYSYFKERERQKREQEQMQNKSDMLQLEQQALYAMMNPHFTFNALQSIQYFIHTQDKLSATKFLTQFAKLVRMNLDSSKTDFISLNDEIERLKLYLSLEKMRFQDKFDYELHVEEGIDKSETQVPPMILQPFVENSLKHGIMPLKEKKGEVIVTIRHKDADTLWVTIQDNGIGIEASKKMKENRPTDHVSKGMKITEDRLKLFSKTTHKEYTIQFEEMKKVDSEEVIGTKVTILLPAKGWE